MIRIFTDSTVNRRQAIKNELEHNDCVFYFPEYTDYWKYSYNNIRKFLDKYKDNKEIALIFPETGLGVYGVPRLALNFFTDEYSENKIIYISTDSQYLFNWIRCSVFLELLSHSDVEIFHDGVLELNKQSRMKEWPDDMFPDDWPADILLSRNINEAKEVLKRIENRKIYL